VLDFVFYGAELPLSLLAQVFEFRNCGSVDVLRNLNNEDYYVPLLSVAFSGLADLTLLRLPINSLENGYAFEDDFKSLID